MRRYSEYRTPKEIRKRVSEALISVSEEKLSEILWKSLRETNDLIGQNRINAMYFVYSFCMEYHLQKGKGTHYFLAPGLGDWLEGAIKEIDENMFKIPFSEGGDKFPLGYPTLIHFPIEEGKGSICTTRINRSCHSVPDGAPVQVSLLDEGGPTFLQISNNPLGCSDEHLDRHHRFLLAFYMYLDAFPDAIVKAGVGDIADWNHFDRIGKSKNHVEMTKELKEDIRMQSMPHYRKAHLRLLTSERFTHKRFQSVLVKGTFVKGRAYEVLDDAPRAA